MVEQHRHLSRDQFKERLGKLSSREVDLLYKAIRTIVGNRRNYNGAATDGQTIIVGPGTGRAFWILSALIDGSTVGRPPALGRGEIDD